MKRVRYMGFVRKRQRWDRPGEIRRGMKHPLLSEEDGWCTFHTTTWWQLYNLKIHIWFEAWVIERFLQRLERRHRSWGPIYHFVYGIICGIPLHEILCHIKEVMI